MTPFTPPAATALLSLALLLPTARADAACEGREIVSDHLLHSPLCVPAVPKRLISLDVTYTLGMSLELGLPVAGAPMSGMTDTQLPEKALAAGVEDIGHFTAPSIERVVAAAPDLIIGSGFLGEQAWELGSRIAPTALITAEDWKTYLATLIEVTGSDQRADTVLADYEARAQALRKRIPEDLEVSVLRITSWDFQVYLDAPKAYAPFAVLRDAGVNRTDYETADSDSTQTLKRPDWEQLGELDGDVLLYIVGGSNDSDTNGRLEEVLANPLWQALPAVEADRAYRVDAATWMEFSGVEAAHRVLDDIERYLIEQP